jgi:hypothetical protein
MIPFIYVYDGGEVVQQIDRPIDIQVLADQFIHRGGRYTITMFTDDVVQAQAVVLGHEGQLYPLATQLCPNGPLLLGAIDRLVRESMQQLDLLH